MNKEKHLKNRIFLCVLVALEFACLLYWRIFSNAALNHYFAAFCFVLVFVFFFALQGVVRIDRQKRYLCVFLLVIPFFIPFVFLRAFGLYKLDRLMWDRRDRSEEKQVLDSGKDYMFSGKKVMVLVPHEDDDVFMMGGVFEQYLKYNSEVYVVFAETGDSGVSKSSYKIGKELGHVRANEAIGVLTSYGIPEDHIIFLGYGSTVFGNRPHLYNHKDEPDKVLKSVSGFDYTYATEKHPAYRDGEKITKNNLTNDYESLLKDYRPDVIFCVDYDIHPGHKSVSLTFESVLGKILKQDVSYSPVVYKGFAYSTSLYAVHDYYDHVNPGATANPYETDYMQETNTYLWKDRIRFPVAADTLTHYSYSSSTARKLAFYDSQKGDWYSNINGIVNSDKVFWERKTNSLLYKADISVSSGDAQVLNDFMLFDCDNIIDGNTDFSKISGIWIPSDNDKKITVKLEQPGNIGSIVLYDNPCLDDNVLNAKIIFEDGTVIETGKLNPNGSATKIEINKDNVKSFVIALTETAGTRSGLSEIEAYGPEKKQENGFIKLMDERGDFVYDYCLFGHDEIRLNLYSYNYDVPLGSDYRILKSNENASVTIEGGQLVVNCPKGQSCIITVSSADNLVSDTVRITNVRHSSNFMAGVQMSENWADTASLLGIKVLLVILTAVTFIVFVPDEEKTAD